MILFKNQTFGDTNLEEQELEGIERFIPIARKYRKQFAITGQTGMGAYFDVAVKDMTGGTAGVENKVRDIEHNKYTSTFVEPAKLENDIQSWKVHGLQMLYINYFADGITMIWDIARIAELGLNNGFQTKWIEKIRWTDKDGKTFYKSGYRTLLPNNLAMVLDENLEMLNREEYEEIFGDVNIRRKCDLLDFEKLDNETINGMITWKEKNQSSLSDLSRNRK